MSKNGPEYDEYIKFYRRTNDLFIFYNHAHDGLDDQILTAKLSTEVEVKYIVPGRRNKGKRAFARRDTGEINKTLKEYKENKFNGMVLGHLISIFESHLQSAIIYHINKYPNKLSISQKGMVAEINVGLNEILTASSREEIICEQIAKRVQSVMYAGPRAYLLYVANVLSLSIDKSLIDEYVEVKATRDIIIHSNYIINSQYIEKAGNKSRGVVGQAISCSDPYLKDAFSLTKELFKIICHQ